MRVLTAQQGVGSMSGGVTLVTQQLLSLRQLTRGACSSRTHEDCNSMHGTSIDAAAVPARASSVGVGNHFNTFLREFPSRREFLEFSTHSQEAGEGETATFRIITDLQLMIKTDFVK